MVNFYKPKSSFLAKYIQGFSVFDKNFDINISFIAFPHIAPAIGLYKNTEIRIKEKHIYISKDIKNRFNTLVLGQYIEPVYITYNMFVDEISIHFTPLGINYFFKESYNEIAPLNFQKIKDKNWNNIIPKIFSSENLNTQLNIVENFLLNQFRKLDLEKFQQSIDLFTDKTKDYKISEISEITGISERTLRRKFKKYIGCSPIKYKRIFRFRNSINAKLKKIKIQNITRIGYKYNFYDSSHFIKELKLFSGNKPRSFFDKVSFFDDSGFPYILL